MIFKNRKEAGILLAKKLKELNLQNPVVVALPRGGVPVGHMVAKELNAALDILFIKKIPSPLNEEAAIGSVSESGLVFLNKKSVDFLREQGIIVDENYIQKVAMEKIQEMAKKRDKYKVEPIPLEDKDVIIVDDGIATGASMYLAANSIVRDLPKSIIIASPIAPADSEIDEMLKPVCTNLVILHRPEMFMSVGQWYEDFHQLSDEEVINVLSKNNNN